MSRHAGNKKTRPMITVHAFSNVPPAVMGLSRDLRVLWALAETGLAHRVHPLDGAEEGSAESS